MRSKQLNLDAYETDKISLGYYFPRGIIVGIDLKVPKRFVPGERIQTFEGNQTDKAFLSDVANKTAPEGFDIIIDDASHIGEKTRRTFWHLFDRHLKSGGLYAIEDWGTGYLDDFPDGRKFRLRTPNLRRVRALLPKRLSRKIKVPFPCHSYGMVGFVKELVDEQGAASVTMMSPTGARRASKFKNLFITPTIVFVSKMAPTLGASSNPAPAAKGIGKTTISWDSVDEKIYVSANGNDEVLFAASPRGSQDANWIDAGSSYEFRLYNSDHTKLPDKVVVTKATQ